jgi:hypothetical protein
VAARRREYRRAHGADTRTRQLRVAASDAPTEADEVHVAARVLRGVCVTAAPGVAVHGIENAVEVGEEIRNARAVIAKGLVSAVILTIVVSVAVSSIALGVFGAGRRRERRAAGRR